MLKELGSTHLDTICGGFRVGRTIDFGFTAPADSLASILGLSTPTGLFFQKSISAAQSVVVVPHLDRTIQPAPYRFAPNPYLNHG